MADTTIDSTPAAASDVRSTALRTFLVADIRDYTRFSEEHGDAAAARLSSAFDAIAREVVEARGGQVTGTRGDEITVAFSSARQALQTAVVLQARFAAAMETDPALPLRVGVGLAAGEVVAVAGGYQGRALTLASTLCNLAGAGEVLASDGLLHLAGRTDGVEFSELRELRMQGYPDPVRVSQVVPVGQGHTIGARRGSAHEPAAVSTDALRIRLLGGFHVTVGTRIIDESEWRLKKAAMLVKFLALSQFHRLHREQVLELLWPDLDPLAAGNNLHHALHVARRILDPSGGSSRIVRLQSELITLEWPGGIWVDVRAFEDAASDARRRGDIGSYRAAIDLYTGDVLPEDLYEDWAEERRRHVRTLYHGLLVEVAALYEAQSDVAPAIDMLQRAVAGDPTLEEAHVALMQLYARSGQRQQALRQYQQLQAALAEELAVEPDAASQELHAEIVSGRVPGATAAPAAPPPPARGHHEGPRHNVPVSLTSFVGREREQRYVEHLLSTTRLLTLTGPGGAGKTRLALAVARDQVDRFADGVRLVQLAALEDPSLVPQAVADVVDVRERLTNTMVDALVDILRHRELLLVLDNCEHLIDACAALVEAFLSTCPQIKIIATSREALNVPGEVTWTVPPLTVPDPRETRPDELARVEAVQLFVERARQRQPSFELVPANSQSVAEIVTRLDGLPLAIELAAARVGILSPEQIAARLEDALGLLTGGRRTSLPHHQTLRATLDWSYDLLDDQERTLFNRLSVFAGGWTLEASEMVGAGGAVRSDDVLDLLSRLMDKSLVQTGASPQGIRYRMLGPVRQYGAEQLDASGAADSLHHRHAILYLSLAEQAEVQLKGARQVEWLNRLDTELDNIRSALRWSLTGQGVEQMERVEIGLRLAGALWQFWHSRGHIGEGREWLRRGLAQAGDGPMAVRAKALNNAGWHAHMQNEVDTAIDMMEESLRLYKSLDDERGVADVLERLGDAYISAGDHALARERHEESLKIRRRVNDVWGISKSLNSLSLFHLLGGDPNTALAMLEQALALARDGEDQRGIAMTSHNMGMVALESGQFERALAPLAESLRIFYRQVDKRDCSFCLEALARLAGAEGKPRRAARLFGAAATLRADVDDRLSQDRIEWLERAMAASRSEDDERSWQDAWEEGRQMPLARAVDYALSSDDEARPRGGRPTPDTPPNVLSPRETEVARLMAEGLTNRQIAVRLAIAERTVDTHVGKILSKLEFASRAQVAAWMTEQERA